MRDGVVGGSSADGGDAQINANSAGAVDEGGEELQRVRAPLPNFYPAMAAFEAGDGYGVGRVTICIDGLGGDWQADVRVLPASGADGKYALILTVKVDQGFGAEEGWAQA